MAQPKDDPMPKEAKALVVFLGACILKGAMPNDESITAKTCVDASEAMLNLSLAKFGVQG